MKKLIFLFVLLFAFNVYASDETESVLHVINSFEKGLNSHVNDYIKNDNSCHDCRNVRFNDVYGGVAKRDELITYGDTGGTNVTSIYRYYKSDDTAHLLASQGTVLQYGDDSAGTFTTLRDGITDGKRWTYTTYDDKVIGMNGYDPPIKWDGSTLSTANTAGHRTALNLCADLGAPFADLTTGTDLSVSSWYQYKVLHKDADGNYYYTNARSNPINTGSTVSTVNLTDIPLGDTDVTSRQIYRTENKASEAAVEAETTFKYVGTISDNTTTTYKDTVADASLGAELSVDGHLNVTPPLGTLSLINDERLFIAGDQSNKSYIYWSEQFKPDYFLATEYEKIRPDDGDEITFIKTLLGILVVGKTNSIQKFHTDGGTTTSWALSDPYTYIGSPAPYSVVNTPKGIMYLSRYGIYLFDGQYSQLASDAVTPNVRDINQANIEECFGVYWDNEYQLAYSSDSSGSATNDRVLIYNLVRDAYAIDYKNINCMTTLESGSDFGSLYYGASDSGYVHEEGASENSLKIRYKSDLDDGDFDDCRSFDTETNATLKLAWDLSGSADFQTLGYLTASGMTTQLGDREDTNGYWVSDTYKISADSLEKLYWNEQLNSYGDIEMRVRLGATAVACEGASWSDFYSTPSGSDISGLTANTYCQLRADLSTSDIIYTPNLYVQDNYLVKLVYDKFGGAYESNVNTYWESHWFEIAPYQKVLLKSMRVYYSKDSDATGNVTFNLQNSEGDINIDIPIDLAKNAYEETNYGHKYQVSNDDMVYTYFFAHDTIGSKWKLNFSDNDIYQYTIKRIEFLGWKEELEDI